MVEHNCHHLPTFLVTLNPEYHWINGLGTKQQWWVVLYELIDHLMLNNYCKYLIFLMTMVCFWSKLSKVSTEVIGAEVCIKEQKQEYQSLTYFHSCKTTHVSRNITICYIPVMKILLDKYSMRMHSSNNVECILYHHLLCTKHIAWHDHAYTHLYTIFPELFVEGKISWSSVLGLLWNLIVG